MCTDYNKDVQKLYVFSTTTWSPHPVFHSGALCMHCLCTSILYFLCPVLQCIGLTGVGNDMLEAQEEKIETA